MTPHEMTASPPRPDRVLVVDDESELMATLCELLRQEGYEAAGYSSGAQALEALAQGEFDVLLADLMMPRMDGITLMREALALDPQLVCLIMTGQGAVSSAVEAMKGGAFDYLLKPFKFSTILPVIARAAQVRRLRLENVQLRETVGLYELTQAIASALDAETILSRVGQAAREQCEADEVSIMLPAEAAGQLRVALAYGEGRASLVGASQPLDGPGIAAWAARTREPAMLNGPVEDERFAPMRARPEIQSAISMPMVAGNRLVGVLNVNLTRGRRRFTTGQVKALSILASAAAAALANAALLEQVRQAEANYRSIFEHAADGIFQFVPDGRLLTVNPALARMTDYASPAALMTDVSNIRRSFVSGEAYDEMIRRLEQDGEVSQLEVQIFDRTDRTLWLTVSARLVRDEAGEVRFVEGIARDITERKQQERRAWAVAQLSTALRGVANRDEMIPVILDQVLALLQAQAADLNLLDPQSDEFVVEMGRGAWTGATGARIPLTQSISAQAMTAGQPQANMRVRTDARLVMPDVIGGVEYATCLPLVAAGVGVGALWVGHAHPLPDEEIRLLAALGELAANALRRATLHEQTRRRAEQLAAVNRLGRALAESLELAEVFHGLAEATEALLAGAGVVYLWLLDAERGVLRCAYGAYDNLPVDVADQPTLDLATGDPHGPAGVARRGEAVIVPADDSRQAALYAPLTARGRAVGVIQVETDRRESFSPADAELLALVANTAAVAVENASLFAETDRRLQRLSGLRVVDQAITSSFDLRVTLNVLLDQVTGQLGVAAADILTLNRHSRVLEFAAARGFRTAALQRTRLQLGAGYAGRAALERRVVSVPNLRGRQTDFLRSPLFAQEDFACYFGVPLMAKGEVKGVLELLHRAPLEPDREWLEFLETLAGQAAIAIDNAGLFDDLQRSNADLILAYDATIEGWSRALDLRDRETEGHTERVTEMTLRLARTIGIGSEEMHHLRRGSLLHDIGKMGIPDSILLKPGPLTPDEWEVMKRHPVYAYEMLSPIAYLRPALDIPYCHHEKWDGTGYPRGLKGEQIPLAARVFAVADVWDALRSDRPYRAAWPEGEVRQYIRDQTGKHFDPQAANAFLSGL